MKNVRSRIAMVVAWAGALLIIILMLQAYTSVVSDKLYDEAKRSFSEVYTQVDRNFLTFMGDTWRNLSDWEPTIRQLDDEETAAFTADRREVWGFSHFLFLGENGEALDAQGHEVAIDLGEEGAALFRRDGRIMAEQGLDGHASETVFAITVRPGTYRGFAYTAIAVTYTNEDLARSLSTEAFSGQSESLVVYPDGAIALSTQQGALASQNFLAHLAADSDMTEQQLADLRAAWEAGERGVVACSLGGTDYYLSYAPLGYESYVLLGAAPVSAVGGALRNVQQMTVDVLVKVFLVLGIVGAMQVFLVLRRRVRRSKAEIAYRDALFDLLSENLDDIFAVIDAETLEVSYITPNVERLLGMVVGEDTEDLPALRLGLADQGRAVSVDKLNSIELGKRHEIAQEWVNRKDGTHRWFREAIYRLNFQGEEKYVFILSDRTDDRRMAQGLEEALATARNASQAKTQFLSSMSHDIRTPMNSILGFTELLDARAEEPDRVRDYVRKITAASHHLLGLINDVLDMSKIESGKTELSVAEFRFEDLVEQVVTIMAPQAAAKGQTFEVREDAAIPGRLLGDKLRVNQILINLLSNAVKYTPEGGTVEFVIGEAPDTLVATSNYANVRFIVRDDGLGMSEDYLKVIFDPFTREETEATSAIQGTGLGMAITKTLVDLMGGLITVESELGKGTTFIVDLPFAVVDPDDAALGAEGAGDDAPVDPEILRGLSILAAEDNELAAEMLMERLDMEGATVQRARDGREAVEMFEASAPGQFDIILMDVQMPIMGGYEAVRAIRGGNHPEAATIPIFAMTANVFAEDVRDALDAGMNAHIPKPIEMDELRRAVDSALNRKDVSS